MRPVPVMRVLVTGASGQVGRALQRNLPPDVQGVFLNRRQLDITDAAQVQQAFRQLRPDCVINCAAFTNVDSAESSRHMAYSVNEHGAVNVARACQTHGSVLLHLSTDYVFNGRLGRAYAETDLPTPLNVYGQSKLAGENGVLKHCHHAIVLRTAWIFSQDGSNFVQAILKQAQKLSDLSVVGDQHGSPTSADDIASALFTIAVRTDSNRVFSDWGIYHFAGEPAVSRSDFARYIVSAACSQGLLDLPPAITETASGGSPAARPEEAVLDCKKIKAVFDIAQPDWRHALKLMLACQDG